MNNWPLLEMHLVPPLAFDQKHVIWELWDTTHNCKLDRWCVFDDPSHQNMKTDLTTMGFNP